MVLQKVGIERMIFEAALFLILVLAMTVPIVKAYESRFGIAPQTYSCEPSHGAGEVKISESIPALA